MAQGSSNLSNLNLGCSDFTRNRDGTWSPAHSIVVGVMAIRPTLSFRAGDRVGGTNLGAILDDECKQQPTTQQSELASPFSTLSK